MTFRTYLVEDSPVIRENLAEFLEEVVDADVVACASTEQEAVTWLQDNPDRWDLAVVDLFLAQGNGLAVVKGCRRRRRAQKVVVLSNYATADMRRRAADYGADAFFDKSSQLDEFVAYCSALVQAHH